MPRRLHMSGPAIAAATLAALTLLCVWFFGRPAATPLGFPLDDAWIHMVYGRSLASDGTLAYNPGEPTTGATSVLWAGLLGVVHLAFGQASLATRIVAVLWLGGLLHVVTAALAADYARRLAGPVVGLIAGILIATNPALAGAALSGMEVSLTAALLIASVRALHLQSWALAGLWLGLAPLARPEAALAAVALVLLSTALDRPADRAAWLRRALALAGPAAFLGLWLVARNLAATDHPLPATYYAKLAHIPWSETPARLWRALSHVLGQTPPLWFGATLLFLGGLAFRSQRRALLPIVAALAYLVAHVHVSELGDPRTFYAVRYLLPIIPALTLALTLGAAALGEKLPRRHIALGLLTLAVLAQSILTLQPVSWKLANDTRNIDELQCAAGRWVHDHVAPNRSVATVDAGAVRYLGERWTLDLLGLNTPQMLWEPAAFTRAHPISAVVFMPGLGKPQNSPEFVAPWSYRTRDYQVTQNPALAFQAIVTCEKATDDRPRELILSGPGLHVLLWCQR